MYLKSLDFSLRIYLKSLDFSLRKPEVPLFLPDET
jgi:hypothetical protein